MRQLIFYLFASLIIACDRHQDIPDNLYSETTSIEEIEEDSITLLLPLSDTDYVVLQTETLAFKNSKSTDISSEELEILHVVISRCIHNEKNKLLSPTKYKRQYFPVINEKGDKEVWVNCFCRNIDGNWKEELILVQDGGNCFFQLKVNLKAKKYYEFTVNGNA